MHASLIIVLCPPPLPISLCLLQAQLDEQLSGLQTLVSSRRQRLEESIKLHQYLRDVEELSTWLEEKQQVAASDDYGKDLDHLLMLQKKFDDFRREVANNTSRYTTVNNTGRKLIAEGEPPVRVIESAHSFDFSFS